MELNSGFVIAIIVAALFLSERLGGDDEWARRVYQIALGGAFAIAVVTGSGAFILEEAGSFGFSTIDQSDTGNRFTIATTVNFIGGFLAVIFGLAGMARQRTIPLGILFGGFLLIAGPSLDFGVIPLASFASSFGARLALFIACVAGFLVLYAYGVDRYERDRSDGSPDA